MRSETLSVSVVGVRAVCGVIRSPEPAICRGSINDFVFVGFSYGTTSFDEVLWANRIGRDTTIMPADKTKTNLYLQQNKKILK